MRSLWPLFILGSMAYGRESICLKSGSCLEADAHMISGGLMTVQSGQGTLQFPVDQVERIVALPPRLSVPKPSPPSKPANSPVDTEELLLRAALRQGLDSDFVRSVAVVESGLNRAAVSPKGAIGLMQLMPLTAGELGVDPNSPDQNALGGALFLRRLLLRYQGDSALALAAYNAGAGAVAKYKGVPPYLETRRYILKVLQEYARQQQAAKAKPPAQ